MDRTPSSLPIFDQPWARDTSRSLTDGEIPELDVDGSFRAVLQLATQLVAVGVDAHRGLEVEHGLVLAGQLRLNVRAGVKAEGGLDRAGLVGPVRRAAYARRYASSVIDQTLRASWVLMRRQIEAFFGEELERAPKETIELLDATLSFETWDRLHAAQDLGLRRTRSLVEGSVLRILTPYRVEKEERG